MSEISEKTKKLYQEYLEKMLDLILNSQEIEESNTTNKPLHNKFQILNRGTSYNPRYSIYDSTYRLIAEKLTKAHDFSDGYALIQNGTNKWNFIDEQGNFLFPEGFLRYDWIDDYHEGYARVRLYNGTLNYIDKNGNLLFPGKKYTGYIGDFHDGWAVVELPGYRRYNYINTNGNYLLSNDEFYTSAEDFNNGIAKVSIRHKGYCYIDTKGQIINDLIFDEIWGKPHTYQKVYVKNMGYNFLTPDGQLIGNEWFNNRYIEVTKCSTNFIVILNQKNKKETVIVRNIDYGKYQVTPVLMGYACKNEDDKFLLYYKPIKIFNQRFILCIDKKNLYLFDRDRETYKSLGDIEHVEYNDNFIITKYYDSKVYLVNNEELSDITDYYSKHPNITKCHINRKIISISEFSFKNEEDIKKLVEIEKLRIQQEKEEQAKDDQKRSEQKTVEDLKVQKQKNKEKASERIKILEGFIQDSIMELRQLSEDNNTPIGRHLISSPFIDVDDHRELHSFIINNFDYFDLSQVSFRNVKVNDIDFHESNIRFSSSCLDPRTVYGKDLSGCNFEGINLNLNSLNLFDDVDIRGAHFSEDDKPYTLDVSPIKLFKNAIYDENTTYNGKPLTEIFEEQKKKTGK